MPDKNAVFNHVADAMVELFELERERIQLSSHLVDDLDIDSIDAVDLIVELKNFVDKNIDPENFKKVRTVEDVVNVVSKLLDDD